MTVLPFRDPRPTGRSVPPVPADGAWLPDARGGDRALRVSWHPEAGCVVLSTWRGDRCTGTTRLAPDDAAALSALLLPDAHDDDGDDDDADDDGRTRGRDTQTGTDPL